MYMAFYFIMAETFKDIPGYEGLYQVSNIGRVKSLSVYYKSGLNSIKERPERIVNLTTSKFGYHRTCLSNGINRKSFLVSRLVAITFIPNPNNYPCVNHINGIKKDNRVENLEWCTHQQNIRHAVDTGLKIAPSGADNKNSKVVYQKDLNGNIISVFPSRSIAAKNTGISCASIYCVISGKWKQTFGYTFSYYK